jgi:hypothetical protein
MMMIEPTKKQIETLLRAMYDVQVQGTEKHEDIYGVSLKYDAPWYVVDTSTAEHDVNYPGDLISTHEEIQEANYARAAEITKRLLAV